MNGPPVSIQIPTYNQRQFIGEAVDSALAQKYDALEVLVADDCSTDDTGYVLQSQTGKRFHYVRQPVNIGRIANYRDALYNRVSGDWVLNLDGDDYLADPDFIPYAMRCIQELSLENIVMFQGNHNITKIKKIFPGHTVIDDDTVLIDGRDYFINFYRVQHFPHCATLFKRPVALPLNFYSFDCLFTDFNSMAKLFLQGKLLISGKCVAAWRLHTGNQSSGLNEQNIQKEMDSITELSAFAAPCFTPEMIDQWDKKMKAYMVTTYIELLNHQPRNPASLRYVLKNFKWNIVYFKQLFRWFIPV